MLDSRLASMLFPPPRRPPPFPANYSNSGRRGIRRSGIPPPPPASGRRDVDTFTEYSGYLFGLSTSEADSLTDYDISRIFAIYRKKPLVVLRRVVQVGATLGKWFAQRYLDTVADQSERMFEVNLLFCFLLFCFENYCSICTTYPKGFERAEPRSVQARLVLN